MYIVCPQLLQEREWKESFEQEVLDLRSKLDATHHKKHLDSSLSSASSSFPHMQELLQSKEVELLKVKSELADLKQRHVAQEQREVKSCQRVEQLDSAMEEAVENTNRLRQEYEEKLQDVSKPLQDKVSKT